MDATLNINFVPKDEIKVYYGTEAHVDNNASVFFIKSGQKEIDDYVDAVSKPEINEYVETQAKPLVTQIVNEIAEPTVAEYIENTVKPELDEYVEDKKPELQAYVTQASEYADNSQASATASAASAAAALTSANNAATSETNAKNYEDNALSSKNAAASSATSASNYANNSKIWAEGTDAQVQALGGEKSAKGWAEASTNLDYTNITNCITAIPQDIKLEIRNGNIVTADTCTVYKGDGSIYTLPASTNFSHATSAGTFMLIWTGVGARHQNTNLCFSGSTAPAQGSFSGSYAAWYDTTNKVIKLTNDGGSTWIGDNSFPLCVYKSTGSAATSIDQVFNGFGYIGSTIFALPGVEGLIPNSFVGKSRNNVKFKTTSVLSRTYGSNETYADAILIINSSQFSTNYEKYYNDKNLNIDSLGRTSPYANCGIASFVNGRITSFNPKTVFQAADYNDVPKLAADNTFTGVNTFDNNGKLLLLDSAARTFNLKSTEYDITEKHAQEYYGIIRFSDKNDKEAGRFDVWNYTENETVARMLVFNKNRSLASIHVLLKDDGTVITYAPTPPTTDNSTQIATTAFVNNFFNTAGKVTTKCMPNYAAGVSISSNYTVPSDGFIFCGLAGNGSESTTINGKRIAVTYDTGVSGSLPQICAPVSKGDVFKTNSQLKWGTFFPCKGA